MEHSPDEKDAQLAIAQPVYALEDEPQIDAEAERLLVRKLDRYLMPIFTFVYLLGFLDKVNLGNAASNGLSTDLKLGTFDFNIGTSIYYVVYMTLDIPATLLVKGVGTWIIPLTVCGFGLVTLGTAFLHGRSGFFGVRCALAFTEMAVLPSLTYICSRYYRRSELTFRICSFYLVGAGLAQAFGGLLATAFFSIESIGSVKGWRVLFLAEGIITIGISPILYFVFPALPEKTRYLTESERELAIARIVADQAGMEHVKEDLRSTIKALCNINTISCIWIFICSNITVQGLAIFTTSILKANYPEASTRKIQLLSVPPPVVGVIVSLSAAYWATKTRHHGVAIIGGAGLSVIGYGIWVGTTSSQASARYAALFLNEIAGYLYGSIVVGWALSNTAPDTARAIVSAALPGLGDIGGFAGVWGYISTDAVTGYRIGNIMNLVIGVSVIVVATVLLVYQKRQNKLRDRASQAGEVGDAGSESWGPRNAKFRYVY